MRIGVRPVLGAAALISSTMIGAVAAQEVVRSPDAIRTCLCQEQSVSTLNGEVQAQAKAYNDKRQTFQTLDKEVQTGRAQVNVNNPGDVDAFKRLLEQRDKAADELAGQATQSYADAVQRYNQAVASYNSSCAGKAFDPDEMAKVKQSLSCPKP